MAYIWCCKSVKIMKKDVIKVIWIIVAIAAFAHGFTDGMEWHRIAACMIGGMSLGFAIRK